ncbi:MAG: transcriptional repressor [Deltaproteobacteria bacterium]|jgi:Fur family zinc uptake transcriptional regulator|nr:transcriptional repressor [Deltaproteobacteria bacterium]
MGSDIDGREDLAKDGAGMPAAAGGGKAGGPAVAAGGKAGGPAAALGGQAGRPATAGEGGTGRLLEQAERLCVALGTPLTSTRRLILEELLNSPGPVKAYDLMDSLRARGHRLNPTTVYRILDFLLRHGLAHRVESLNSFVACRGCGITGPHLPFIVVCPDCRAATEINDERLRETVFGRLGILGFKIRNGTVEVRGVCRKCAEKDVS